MTMNESRLAEPQDDLQLPLGNSGSGTCRGYQVQARYMSNEPKQFDDMLLDQRWRTIQAKRSPIGVPTHRGTWEWQLPASNCMSYEAAQALRWWFLAECRNGEFGGTLCIETRIVAFQIKYSHEAKADDVLEQPKEEWRNRPL